MTDLIQINGTYDIQVNKMFNYGGIQYDIHLTAEIKELLNWVRKHKQDIESEEKLRTENPILSDLYNQYNIAYNLIKD